MGRGTAEVHENFRISKSKCRYSKDNLLPRHDKDEAKQEAFLKCFLYQTRISPDDNEVKRTGKLCWNRGENHT